MEIQQRLAAFAEKHWDIFSRIQLIRKKVGPDGTEKYYRLDVGDIDVREKVIAINNNDQLDQIFEDNAFVM